MTVLCYFCVTMRLSLSNWRTRWWVSPLTEVRVLVQYKLTVPHRRTCGRSLKRAHKQGQQSTIIFHGWQNAGDGSQWVCTCRCVTCVVGIDTGTAPQLQTHLKKIYKASISKMFNTYFILFLLILSSFILFFILTLIRILFLFILLIFIH